MTLSEMGSIGEVIGAAATVATLLYLSLQIRANTLASNRQSLDDIIDRVVRWEKQLAGSPEMLQSWLDGHENYGGLALEDQVRFQSLMVEILAAFESNFEAAKFGDVKPETVEVIREMTAHLFQNAGARDWWEQSGRVTFAADFVREVDAIREQTEVSHQNRPGPLPFRLGRGARASGKSAQ